MFLRKYLKKRPASLSKESRKPDGGGLESDKGGVGDNQPHTSKSGRFSWKCSCGHELNGDPSAHQCPAQKGPDDYDPVVESLGVDGCFSGESTVSMDSGGFKAVRELKKGDLVKCNVEGEIAEVKCVLVQRVTTGRTRMVEFETGLIITPMHPIMYAGTWTLPKDLKDIHEVQTDQVFNFLLDRQHTIVINGITCAALGHRRSGHTSHPFWGNWDRLVGCMRCVDASGFEDGLVEIAGAVRAADTGTVYGLKGTDGRSVIA